jgi:hypothetical protein
MGVNPIQISEVEVYARIFGEPSIGLGLLTEFIALMDDEYLSLEANANQSDSVSQHSPGGGGVRRVGEVDQEREVRP